jgi:hypothetical protein
VVAARAAAARRNAAQPGLVHQQAPLVYHAYGCVVCLWWGAVVVCRV